MKLHAPFQISARLLPALHIAGAWISIEATRRDQEGRTVFRYTFDLPDGTEFTQEDLKSGVGRGDLVEAFVTLLSFLTSGEPENLFPSDVASWATQNSDEIDVTALEIAEASERGVKLIEP